MQGVALMTCPPPSIRLKTGQVISAKACPHIKGLALSSQKKAAYNSTTNKETIFRDMMLEDSS